MLKIADQAFVESVIQHPRVLRWTLDDGRDPQFERYIPHAVYFRFEDKGYMMFQQASKRMWEVHIAMIRGGAHLVEWVLECLQEMRRRGVLKFVAPISGWNLPAIRLARKCGFVEEGRINGALEKFGAVWPLVLMGAE